MDHTAHRAIVGDPSSGERSAAELRRDPVRVDDARRLAPARSAPSAWSGSPSSPPGCSARRPARSRCSPTSRSSPPASASPPARRSAQPARGVAVHGDRGGRRAAGRSRTPSTTTRVRDLPPVTSGQVGAYLGAPLTDTATARSSARSACSGPTRGSGRTTDVATLRRLAESVVTELELSALVREYEGDRLRWGLAIDAAGIGTFDWDLVTGRLAWDDQLIAMFGYDVERLRPEHRGVQRPAAPRRPAAGHRRAAAAASTPAASSSAEYRVVRARRRDPLGARPRPRAARAGRHRRAAARRGLRHHRRAGRSRPRDPGAGGDAGRLLQPGPGVAVHPRQRRGRAAARAQPRGPARPGASGTTGRPPSTAPSRTATAPPSGPGSRSPSTPTTPRR